MLLAVRLVSCHVIGCKTLYLAKIRNTSIGLKYSDLTKHTVIFGIMDINK